MQACRDRDARRMVSGLERKSQNITHPFPFLLCRDTVASVGFLIPRTLPLISGDTIRAFRHCISLDEHRVKFDVTLWRPEDEVTGRHALHNQPNEPSVKEVWFAGGHGGKIMKHHPYNMAEYDPDVGGGEVTDSTPSALANIPLRWMLHEMDALDIGIMFNNEALDRLGIPEDCVRRESGFRFTRTRVRSDETAVDPSETTHKEKSLVPPKTWAQLDEEDAMAGLHDELQIRPLWWLLQFPEWNGMR